MNFDKFLDALTPYEMDELRDAVLRRFGKASQHLNSEEVSMALRGDKIGAIRSIRSRNSVGIIEAKALVDSFLTGN